MSGPSPSPHRQFGLPQVVVLLALLLGLGILLLDARTRGLVANSGLLALATLAIAIPWGCWLAWMLARTNLPGRRLAWLGLASVLLVPLYLQAGAWRALGGLEGWWTVWQGQVLLEGWRATIWIHAMAALPWVVVIVGVALRTVEPELESAALLEGSTLQTAWHVTWPRSRAAVAVAALWIVVLTGSEMTVTDIFQVRTFAEEVFTQMAIGDPDLARQRILPATLTLATLAYVAMRWFAERLPKPLGESYAGAWEFRLRRWPLAWAGMAVTFLIIVVALPVGSLVYEAGIHVEATSSGYVRSWSLPKAIWMVIGAVDKDFVPSQWRPQGDHQREILNTLILASVTATVATILGALLAWRMRRGGWLAGGVWFLLAVAMAVPGPVVGISIIELLNRPEVPALVWLYDRTILAPVLATLVRSLPWATLVLWQALRSVGEDSLETAQLEGATSLTRLWQIALAQRWPAIVCSWLLAAVIAAGDVATSVLVVPPGFTTLSIQIFNLLHYGVEDQVAAILLAELVFFLAMAAIAALLIRRFMRPRNRTTSGHSR